MSGAPGHGPVPVPDPSPGRALLAGALAGALAAGTAGVIDGLWSWSALQQFTPGVLDRLRVLVFLAASHALVGAAAGAVLGVVVGFFAWRTRLGGLMRVAAAMHAEARARDPRDALAGLALVLTGIPCVALLLWATYERAVPALHDRKHMGLVIAASMGLALIALCAGALATFAIAPRVETLLRGLCRIGALGRALSSLRAPLVAAAALLIAGGALAARAAWETLALLPLRPAWVGLLAAALAAPSTRHGLSLAARLRGRRVLARAALPGGLLALFLATIAAGNAESVRKAANAFSGLGGPITHAIRAAVDLDRDGFSPILGGGDCDDWDRDVHPGAVDIPDDGIDQNCVGGDASLQRSVDDVAFADVPARVPPDFNVLFLTIDTIRADHLGAYGYQRPTSPAIDAVARDGALFVNAWAHAPSTRYSIPALLTGRYPLSVRYDTSVRGWPGLSEQNTTLAELMKQAGMTTAAILNYWYFDRQRRMDQGFDSYDNENQRLHTSVPGEGPAETKGTSSRQQTDKALAFLERVGTGRFFLWVHYYDPHYRYESHADVPSFGAEPIDLYDQEIRYTDLHIGRLIDDLKRRGLYERTIIVITGDHGEGFGEHGIYLHGYHLYAAQTKVPLIIRVPGLAPVAPTTPVAHIDVLPTLANLAGLAPSTEMMGRSLVDILSGQRDPHLDRFVFQQLSYENNNEMRAAASKQCHVIYNVSPHTSWELYRVDIDPGETRDIIDRPGPCQEARAALEAWYDRAELPEGAAEALLPSRPALARELGVDLGDEIRLLDVELPAGEVRAGHGFEVIYTFAARGRLRGEWRVFAHFEGPRGRRFLGDHAPARPIAWWRDGQYIRYAHTVMVPRDTPPGTYELWTGLFRKAERRPARSEAVPVHEDRARVGAVRIAP